MSDEEMKELQRIYKYVLLCKHCGHLYGSDNIEDKPRTEGLCPICNGVLAKRRRNSQEMKGGED